MEKSPPGRNPGLIWCNSKVTQPDELGRDSFCRWYSDIHIPDVLKSSAGVREAFRYLAVDPNEELFHMALYYVDDLESLYDKIKWKLRSQSSRSIAANFGIAVPHHHESVPGSQDMFDYGFFDTRFYKSIQIYEQEEPKSDQPDYLLSTEMLPADEQDFDDWYRQEHLVDGSKISGWRRTERFELVNPLRTEDAPKYLTLLFIDGPSIPMKDLERAGSSAWTQKIIGGMKKMRTIAFHKSTHHVAGESLNAGPLPSSL